jgi:hypothetical protein
LDVPSKSPSDVPSESPSDGPPTSPSDAEPLDVPSTSPSDVPPTSPPDAPPWNFRDDGEHIDSDGPTAPRIAILHCKAGTGKKNHELNVPSTSKHLSDVPSKSPSDVPSTSPSDVPPTRPSEATTYYDTSSEIMDLLAHKSVSTDVINDVRHIFASQREFKPRNPDVPKELFISCNPDFRKSWSRLDEKTRISNLHCKAGTGKKNHELQVQHHELQVLQDRFYDASDTSRKKIPRSGRSNLPTKSSLHPGHPARMLSKSKIQMQHLGNLLCDSAINIRDLDNPQSECTTPSFVYFSNDGEHIDSDGPTAPPWTQFEVTLKDVNGNPRLDSKGDPITVIAPPPS